DGQRILVLLDGTLKVFDRKSRQQIRSTELPAGYFFDNDSIIDDNHFVVRNSVADCKMRGVKMLDLAERLHFVDLVNPTWCGQETDEDLTKYHDNMRWWSSQPRIISVGGAQKIFIARYGVPELHVWDMRTQRMEPTINWPGDTSADLMAVSSDLTIALSLDG